MAGLRVGTRIDLATGKPTKDVLSLESEDFTTHGVIVGMTGSGKTGLAVVLLEEILSAGIPALILDPKGDMGNLLLTFPDFSAASFRPWVNEDDARRENMTVDELADRTAKIWRSGLAAAEIGSERVQALRDAAELSIYTPGSEAGIPLNVIGSFAAPALSWDTEAETLRDEIEGTVTSLLGLVGIDADPLSSREFVLLANLVEHAWRAGQDLDLGALIGQVQAPPLRKLGVFDLDTFFPPKERTELALKLNALVASPSFAAWGQGQPLDPQTLLHTPEGKPRAAIVYLAHLSEEERQFVVTLVLSKLVTWMRGQPGTSDLRALVYMDEVFGYVPPTAAPPAKKPILTIFKQGRAFGVGMVLATQNPVDLDYKAMSNAGLWMVGRLQTENDKARVLEGLRSAAGGVDVAKLDAAIGALDKRQFLLVSAKSGQPVLFSSRWAMSYLRGPLTKDQVATLMEGADRPGAGVGTTTDQEDVSETDKSRGLTPVETPTESEATGDTTPIPPPVAFDVPVLYLDPAASWAAQVDATPGGRLLRLFLAARVQVQFDDAKTELHEQQEYEALYGPLDGGLDLESELTVDYDDRDFVDAPPTGAMYRLPSVPIDEASFFTGAERHVVRRLVSTQTLELSRNRELKLVSRPGETPEQFAQRCDEAAQTAADAETAKIRDRLEARRDRLEDAREQAERRLEELSTDERSRQTNELVAGAGAVLGALLGGRRNSRSIADAIGGAASRRGISSRTAARKQTAKDKVERISGDLEELEQEILDEVQEIDEKWRLAAAEIDPVAIRPEASDVRVQRLALVWVPTAAGPEHEVRGL